MILTITGTIALTIIYHCLEAWTCPGGGKFSGCDWAVSQASSHMHTQDACQYYIMLVVFYILYYIISYSIVLYWGMQSFSILVTFLAWLFLGKGQGMTGLNDMSSLRLHCKPTAFLRLWNPLPGDLLVVDSTLALVL